MPDLDLYQPSPPDHLKPETAEWFSQVVAEYSLDTHHVRLLELACEAWDRCQDARVAIEEHGTIFYDRFGAPKMRPEVLVEKDSRKAFAAILRELDLDGGAPGESRLPPLSRNGG